MPTHQSLGETTHSIDISSLDSMHVTTLVYNISGNILVFHLLPCFDFIFNL